MDKMVSIVGAGLAGSECALSLAERGIRVRLHEMRPQVSTAVHETALCAELVCSNSLKSTKPASAAGMLKVELDALGSRLYAVAQRHRVPAGGALAVDRVRFSKAVDHAVRAHPLIQLMPGEVESLAQVAAGVDAVVLASGPLTSDALAANLAKVTGAGHLAFFDAAAPIVMADSLDLGRVFRQSRYEDAAASPDQVGDYLNAPFSKDEYERFIAELTDAERVIARDFETRDLFQACQPIEEIARKGHDAPRFGPLKPVGLTDPRTGRRPWAALQLRAENAEMTSYNLVGFQTNLTFGEQRRVFRMIPGLERAEFARYGVMHRNTFIDAPRLLDAGLRLAVDLEGLPPVWVAGQLAGTEGYSEAIRSGLHVALHVTSFLSGADAPVLPRETAFGALLAYACDPQTVNYQPMHVNFGLMPPLERPVRNRGARYEAFAARGADALARYADALRSQGLLGKVAR
ncbi:methylenetetrahydrofolate--tRNA-(uracil(54)-C(5))-methyltransferase (FADH(2)-oxidizing) TrmFO [Eggerthellaceae bacterium zg-1084]|uniref:Methylenetetrahydrofolate--tRNA-(uracil-5-)-methyltransferase TrmFO n=1 Tax=Berryella wangjianweii TaxID=2734634 RepID=A0A6M8J147_9ACTN|nr:methylenetetrahydrofolate--tRNA-(uracil(54)-C(5))-methyltransferase (FADH(2)-oxidizing) TrmFO [Berryella wangjianweii]NPD31275.1 methylenetetrahydrofolate--tRNA-(uracil(54)-C(5))-methyltransferase (FADH(2)-oxidizing) TrmFO [Berryella wangjianweii]NPD32416.1 methylenetetrahydrofolate--tRNA-(uracil(54)-C(5))-methyltransferase (FADH(2)-oxidizing) TrmFO [Eggerthellaceae bacterium zg-997]QKF06821.1 methylenetetrahydrofolate--tRNA-(uracil(54)-C(5))-methyltransferase (FADH(2)-oxidizing) TrmFO [Berry